MRERIIGRKDACEQLEECMYAPEARLILLSGRSGVGKTFLIEEFFEQHVVFTFTGTFEQPKEVQLENFASELRYRLRQEDKWAPESWSQAFEGLRAYLESRESEEKQVLFLDDMACPGEGGSSFLPAFI